MTLEGNNIFMVGGEEVARYGIDGEEFGGRLPLSPANKAILGLHAGGYWFDDDDAFQEIVGPGACSPSPTSSDPARGSRARYEVSYDDVRGDRHMIGAGLRIPLGARPRPASDMSPQEWRMSKAWSAIPRS